MKLTKRVADLLALRVLRQLVESNILRTIPRDFSWSSFHKLRQVAKKSFYVPESSLTPLMARVYFGIAACLRPKRILGIGTYTGSSLLWLSGPFLYQRTSNFDCAYGVDTDKGAVTIAKTNFHKLGQDTRVRFFCADGHEICRKLDKKYDLLLIDADDSVYRKRIYETLLNATYPFLTAGALVLAHDVIFPKFKNDLVPYFKIVRDSLLFERSVTLEIDRFGLEVSKKINFVN